jgi:hypothetical protein
MEVYLIISGIIVLVVIILCIISIIYNNPAKEPYVTYTRLAKKGQFGNQLFQIASVIGIAEKNNMKYKFPYWNYSKYFENALPYQHEEIASSNFSDDIPENYHGYQDIVLNKNHKIVDINGWRQSEKYFNKYKDKVLHYFKFKQEYINNVYEKLPILKQNCISIHVRRGDYIIYPGFVVLSFDYYNNAVNYIKEKMPIVIVSDDIEWCKQNLKNLKGPIHYSPFTFLIDDLICLHLCAHSVMSASSFSWWGAWLSNHNKLINRKHKQVVVAPKPWFNGPLSNKNTDDIYCKDWKLMEY